MNEHVSDDDDGSDLDTVEQTLRIEQMRLNIVKMQADMRLEQKRFTLQIVTAIAAASGAGVALGSLLVGLLHR